MNCVDFISTTCPLKNLRKEYNKKKKKIENYNLD